MIEGIPEIHVMNLAFSFVVRKTLLNPKFQSSRAIENNIALVRSIPVSGERHLNRWVKDSVEGGEIGM